MTVSTLALWVNAACSPLAEAGLEFVEKLLTEAPARVCWLG
jgi:hypothetical protein